MNTIEIFSRGRPRIGRAFAFVIVTAGLLAATTACLTSCSGCFETDLPSCGDGKVEAGEECDDGNRDDGDGCSSQCLLEAGDCGNGVCDPASEDGASCPQDCWCGDGVVDSTEDCEQGDVQGTTCSDFEACTGGTLSCDDRLCLFDWSGCVCPGECGDGIVGTEEECDDANLIDDDECRNDCTWNTELCGNGVIDHIEECDCGADPENLPLGCSDVNGSPFGRCADDCTEKAACSAAAWETCDMTAPDDCCPDSNGTVVECTDADPSFEDPICMVPCADTSECYYNAYCEPTIGFCDLSKCGGGSGGELNEPCTFPNGEDGWCLPFGFARDATGFCMETGTVAQGEACDTVEGGTLEWTLMPRSQQWDRCDMGICLTDNTCAELCDWKDSWQGSSTCPQGTNCFAQSVMRVHDPNDPHSDPADEGLRTAEVGVCITREETAGGLVTCDLTNGETITDRAQTCADVLGAGYMCYPITFQSGEAVFGVPIGWCIEAASEVNVGLWDTCEMSNDLCPEGSFCFPTDTTDMSSQARCMPFCHTEAATPCPAQAGVPTDVECFTMSAWFRPGTSQGEVADESSPSTLGLCACPEGGCSG
jgi:cysteine-rich repeat protein